VKDDLDPISSVAVSAFVLAIHPSVPARSLKEFAAYAKAQSVKISYAAAPPSAVMNSRLFNRSNCIRWPSQLLRGSISHW
jgi:tripartite-type tricarboxylate transporter receptor subunit TctC